MPIPILATLLEGIEAAAASMGETFADMVEGSVHLDFSSTEAIQKTMKQLSKPNDGRQSISSGESRPNEQKSPSADTEDEQPPSEPQRFHILVFEDAYIEGKLPEDRANQEKPHSNKNYDDRRESSSADRAAKSDDHPSSVSSQPTRATESDEKEQTNEMSRKFTNQYYSYVEQELGSDPKILIEDINSGRVPLDEEMEKLLNDIHEKALERIMDDSEFQRWVLWEMVKRNEYRRAQKFLDKNGQMWTVGEYEDYLAREHLKKQLDVAAMIAGDIFQATGVTIGRRYTNDPDELLAWGQLFGVFSLSKRGKKMGNSVSMSVRSNRGYSGAGGLSNPLIPPRNKGGAKSNYRHRRVGRTKHARKYTDWDHIFENHSKYGKVARQRTTGDTFQNLSKGEIKKVVNAAWKNRKTHPRKGNKPTIQEGADGNQRIIYRGDVNLREWKGTIEMHFNISTKTLETAYPKGSGPLALRKTG